MLGLARILPKVHHTDYRMWPTGYIYSLDLFNLGCNVLFYLMFKLVKICCTMNNPKSQWFTATNIYFSLIGLPAGWGSAALSRNPQVSSGID